MEAGNSTQQCTFSLAVSQKWWASEAGRMRYGMHADYLSWLQKTCQGVFSAAEAPRDNDSVPLWHIFASTDATSGRRDVLPAALIE